MNTHTHPTTIDDLWKTSTPEFRSAHTQTHTGTEYISHSIQSAQEFTTMLFTACNAHL